MFETDKIKKRGYSHTLSFLFNKLKYNSILFLNILFTVLDYYTLIRCINLLTSEIVNLSILSSWSYKGI